ncbi:hypothetical protein [Microbacterium sp.]|uniref:hypothetical protein n=1 Tax=Microbacterium sp. TaxID=51671 RepID=UPI0028A0E96A|nr:hypothetical protein [Microbacterium sp.]
MSELDDLRARVQSLEEENASLRVPRKSRWSVRSIVSGIILVLAIILAPTAAIGTWARTQLVDTDQFVATFAPLANDPAVQDFVADQVVIAIDEQLDLDSLVGEVFDGLRDLDLPPRAEAALGILEAPASQGLASLVDGVVHDLVASEQFASVWSEALRFTHDRAIAVLQEDPDIAVQLGDDGVIAIDLSIVIERVKEILSDRGVGFADLIPVVEKTIPIAQADALVLVRSVYQIAVTTGFWLPWFVLALVVGGILFARNRSRAILGTSIGFALVFALIAAGARIGRGIFVGSVSPAIMPAGAATAVYSQVSDLLFSTVVALAFLGVVVAVAAWFAGRSRSAMATRGITTNAFASLRHQWERRGVTTGRFGELVGRYRGVILIVGSALGTLILIVNRPVSFGSIAGVTCGLIVLLVSIELLRRPTSQPERESPMQTAGDPDGAPVG